MQYCNPSQTQKIENLNFLSFNVEGLESMLLDPTFTSLINSHDICVLVETMKKDDSKLNLANFWDVSQVRPKEKKIGRYSGGITLLVKSHLRKGVKIAHNTEGLFWLRLCKNFFKLRNDLYVCATYIPPQSSKALAKTDYFSDLLSTANSFLQKGNVIIAGDLNARIGRESMDVDIEIPHLTDLLPQGNTSPRLQERSACDLITNQHGRKLIKICNDLNLFVANGRTPGDLLGNLTCFTNNGSSTVDLVIADQQMIHKIRYLKVLPPEYTSVHTPITFKVRCDLVMSPDSSSSIPLPPKLIWDPEKVPVLREALLSPVNLGLIQNITATLVDPASTVECIDKCLHDMNNMLLGEARKCMKISHSKQKCVKKPKQQNCKWYDAECTSLKNRLKNQARLLISNPKDSYIRGQYNKAKKLYRKTVKMAKRQYEIEMITSLQEKANNPKEFWAFLKKINKGTSIDLSNSNIPSPDEWFQHFSSLNALDPSGIKPVTEQVNNVIQEVETNLNCQVDTPSSIMAKFKPEEVLKGTKSLKIGKAVATDLISNDILKATADIIIPLLVALFDKILTHEVSPEDWSLGIITPLFKSGEVSDANCYRGITINSCLSKLFMLLMNNRLQEFCDDRGIINFNQIGFTKGYRPADHVFTMKTVIDKSIHNKKPLHVCFVDFRKAYDSVWRDGLYKKLLSYNVDKRFIRLLRNIYSSSSLAVKTQNGRSRIFESKVGLKQGCNLSPLLFNLFINDLLSEINGQFLDSPTLNGVPINGLMYADDLVLISESENGLQVLLDILHNYTKKWFLQVNKSKTKYMRIDRFKSSPLHNIKLGETPLEKVDEYCYLGTIFTSNGSLNSAGKALHEKARKAMYGLLRRVNKHYSCNPKLLWELFDKMIMPIAMYNVEVWGTICFPCNKNNDDFLNVSNTKNPIEDIQTKFGKRVLAVNDRCTNWAVLTECGRTPTITTIMKNMISFWLHLANSQNPIMKAALQTNADLSLAKNVNSWFSFLSRILKFLGLEHLLYTSDVQEINLKVKGIKRILQQKAVENWQNLHDKTSGRQDTKLGLFCKTKTEFGMSTYLSAPLTFKERRAITKLRTSSHNLPIETDRYEGIDNRSHRLCPLCNEATGDEAHYLTECSFEPFVRLRTPLLSLVCNKSQNFPSLSRDDKATLLLDNPDIQILSQVGKVAHEIMVTFTDMNSAKR